ncbi:MAG: hypothetical protein Q8M03_02005 [Legionella sp.]|nr:hypothetical protein [Legionella sp.]
MTTDKTNGHNGHGTNHGGDFAAFMRARGHEHVLAWILRRDGEGKGKAHAEGPPKEEPPAEEPKSAEANRKTKQRKNDDVNGWRQCNVKAPNDDDARALMAEIGIRIKNPEVRAAIRIATKNPELVVYGATASALQGFLGLIVRAILGKLKAVPNHDSSGL